MNMAKLNAKNNGSGAKYHKNGNNVTEAKSTNAPPYSKT